MHKLPESILAFFNQAIDDEQLNEAENKLLEWLLTNNIEELNCSGDALRVAGYHFPKKLIPRIAKVIAKSSVHDVDFCGNYLGVFGPETAANLTGEHSKVQKVGFSWNALGAYGPETAANLTGEYSKVRTVNLTYNGLCTHGPQTALNLTGEHSKVHTVDLSNNGLGADGPQTAANLTGEHSKVESVSLYGNNLDTHGPETAKNLTGKYSKVRTVSFGANKLGIHGPETAANLTSEHSKVLTVNFSSNELGAHGPDTAKNLTGRYSKVLTVNFNDNKLGAHAPKTTANLISEYAKIIKAEGVDLTQQQLTNNAFNLFLSLEKDLNTLEARCAKIYYPLLLTSTTEESLAQKILPIQHQASYIAKTLLYHYGKLTSDDIVSGKADKITEHYFQANCQNTETEQVNAYVVQSSKRPHEEIVQETNRPHKKRKLNQLNP